MRIACIQVNSGADWEKNWKQTSKYLSQASKKGVSLVALPENFILRASEAKSRELAPKIFKETLNRLKKAAKEFNLTLVAGSLLEPSSPLKSKSKTKFYNTCFVISNRGKVLLRYRKMHLFDINLPEVKIKESRIIVPGSVPGMFKSNGVQSGVGICYDLRFPEYFRLLSKKGVEVLFVPANFTAKTGKTAWVALLRARAIENQCFVIAPGQCGTHPGLGVLSYGNSLVIDPLGKVLKRANASKPQILVAELKIADLRRFRRFFPVLKHRKVSI